MKNTKKNNKDHRLRIDGFDDIIDSEFLEAVEYFEKLKKKKLSEEEIKKLEYIRKNRQKIVGGDA